MRTTGGRIGTRGGRASACAFALACLTAPAVRAATPAAATLTNTARASFVLDGAPGATVSNTVATRVAEVLDVTVKAVKAETAARSGDHDQALAFRVTNTGNGREAVALAIDAALTGDDFNPTLRRVVIDSNGDGGVDDGDATYAPGVSDPVLDPGASVTVFVVCDIPVLAAGTLRGRVSLSARDLAGSGRPGTLFTGRGVGGVDAVAGATGAAAEDVAAYLVAPLKAELIKSQAVTDPTGGAAAVSGSVVTYTLLARLSGTGALKSVAVADPVPVGAAYVPGSLKLDGASLSDAGAVTDAGIKVSLGDLVAPAEHTVSFSVRIP